MSRGGTHAISYCACLCHVWRGAGHHTPAGGSAKPSGADCRVMPLPSAMSFALDQYEARLHKFLQAQCYIHLGWTHDARVCDTGLWITQFAAPDGDRSQPDQWSISNYGLHGTVLIYYSPDVFRWMQERDTVLREGRDLATLRPIADGSMILKFMLAGDDNKTAADFPDIRTLQETAIAAIVKEVPYCSHGQGCQGIEGRLVLGYLVPRNECRGPTGPDRLATAAKLSVSVDGSRQLLRELPCLGP